MRTMITQKEISAWLRDWLVLTAAVMIGTWVVGEHAHLAALLAIAATISLLNALLKPLLLRISLPFLLMTFGLGLIFVLWFINALFLYLAWNWVVDSGLSFARAMLGAFFVSCAQFFLNLLFGIRPQRIDFGGNGIPPQNPPRTAHKRSRHHEDGDDAIDI